MWNNIRVQLNWWYTYLPLWKMMEFVSWDYYSQYMENNMFQTTNQYCMLDYQRERERGYGLGSLYIRKCFCTLCKWCVANQHLSGSIMTWPWESNGFMAMSEEICRVTTGYMYLAWSHMFYGLGVHIYMFSFRLKCAWDIHVADSPSGDCCCCPWGLPDRIRDS